MRGKEKAKDIVRAPGAAARYRLLCMANPEHLSILKQGTEPWNQWRKDNFRPGCDLRGANLRQANLPQANLSAVDLREADLSSADLTEAYLGEARLSNADLSNVSLRSTYLGMADLRGAHLHRADLSEANLRGADLREAYLVVANLSGADLGGAKLSGATLSSTVFGDTNLLDVRGLELCRHSGLSFLDYHTLAKSGPLPLPFLRGCGFPDEFIEYLPSLLDHAIQFYSCFISYSTKDKEFADRLHADLQNKGVRCWFAPHDVRAGRKLHDQVDEAIRLYDRLLLILSGASMESEWVKTEIAHARQKELNERRQVLFPISLVPFSSIRKWKCFDADTGKDSAREIREYYVPDFSNWKDHNAYQQAFTRLIADLKAEKRGPLADLKEAREELSAYRCPYCAAPLALRISAPADREEKYWDTRESFECGFRRFCGFVECPCPADPRFPKFEDYDLHFFENPKEPQFKWQCHASGKTDMARKLELTVGLGRTKEEAENQVRERYDRCSSRFR
jgi:hypothetical protein